MVLAPGPTSGVVVGIVLVVVDDVRCGGGIPVVIPIMNGFIIAGNMGVKVVAPPPGRMGTKAFGVVVATTEGGTVGFVAAAVEGNGEDDSDDEEEEEDDDADDDADDELLEGSPAEFASGTTEESLIGFRPS